MATSSSTPPHTIFRNHLQSYLQTLLTSPSPSTPSPESEDTDTKTAATTDIPVADKVPVIADPSPADGVITHGIARALLGELPPPTTTTTTTTDDTESKTTTTTTPTTTTDAAVPEEEEFDTPFMPFSTGYPTGAFYVLLADRVVEWATSGVLPLTLPPMDRCVEIITAKELLTARQTAVLDAYRAAMASSSSDEAAPHVGRLLDTLGVAGLHCLLGMRRTVGTVNHLPPPRSEMMRVFNLAWKTKARLSVGARALTKHSHRSSESFWGVSKGSEAVKNDWAQGVIERILTEAVWINCHTLPHNELVVEMRIAEGYGARWRIDGSMFRGFLEPQMEGGHEKGWKH